MKKKSPDDYIGTLINMKLDGNVLTIKLRLTDDEVKAYRPKAGAPPKPIVVAPRPAPRATLDALIEDQQRLTK